MNQENFSSKLKQALGQFDMEAYAAKIQKEEEILSYQKSKIFNYLKNLSQEDFDTLATKFLKWERNLQEKFFLKRHMQKSSSIFETVIQIFNEQSVPIETNDSEEDDFFGVECSSWRGYDIETIYGQGVMIFVYKDGEGIFAST